MLAPPFTFRLSAGIPRSLAAIIAATAKGFQERANCITEA